MCKTDRHILSEGGLLGLFIYAQYGCGESGERHLEEMRLADSATNGLQGQL